MITITENAKNRLYEVSNNKFIRLEIVSGGCSGFSREFKENANPESGDTLIEGILLIDKESFQILKNSTIDYKNELQGSFFSIEIPESASTCGCGTSFSL